MLGKRERGHKWSPGQWLLPPIGCGRFRGLKMAVRKGMHRSKKGSFQYKLGDGCVALLQGYGVGGGGGVRAR
jgi:hypothetical protein